MACSACHHALSVAQKNKTPAGLDPTGACTLSRHLTGAWEEDPGEMAVTTAKPDWEEEMSSVALVWIWDIKCCIAIESAEFF